MATLNIICRLLITKFQDIYINKPSALRRVWHSKDTRDKTLSNNKFSRVVIYFYKVKSGGKAIKVNGVAAFLNGLLFYKLAGIGIQA